MPGAHPVAAPVVRTAAPMRLADRFGALASLLCAAHCALLPLLFALLPSLGLGVAGQVGFERGFALFATALALVTLVAGYRQHRALAALAWLTPGLLLVWVGAFAPIAHAGVAHALLMTVGGTLVGAAHLVNLRLGRQHVHGPACSPRRRSD